MIVLGIDPGIATTGYGVVRDEPDGSFTALDYGVLLTPKTDSQPARLVSLRQQLIGLINQWRPTESAVEALFFATNAKTAMSVGQARGVILVTLHEAGLPIGEYTPLQVKQAVTGYGQADKLQMQTMVKMLFTLESLPRPDDAADALAIAFTHFRSSRYYRMESQ
ncbi:MAG TPA: crossover junction endodeoxyribonuclease RuvC [Anaerolineae bacterium]